MNNINQCKQCFINEGIKLLDNFFPIGKDFKIRSNRISTVNFNEDGLCQYCLEYNKNFDREIIRKEVVDFINEFYEGNYHSLVAVSGGKDSLTALFLAVKVLNLKVLAFTYDNGFIPEFVIEQTRKICLELDVPYIVIKKTLYSEFKNEYQTKESKWEAKTGIDFCQICSKQINQVIKNLSEEYMVNKVIFGNKVYTELSPNVSSIKKLYLNINDSFKQITTINFLFALDIKNETQQEILREMKWVNPNLPGYTSNCLIPGFVDFPRSKKIGNHSDAGYIEMEFRSGLYNKSQAKDLLDSKPIMDLSSELDDFFSNIEKQSN